MRDTGKRATSRRSALLRVLGGGLALGVGGAGAPVAYAQGAQGVSGAPRPPGVSLLPDDALGAFRLGGSAAREGRVERVSVGDGPVPAALRVRTERRPAQSYEVQLTAKTVAPVESGDVLLVTFFMRAVETAAETNEGRTTVVLELARAPYTKSLQLTVDAGSDWRRIDMPFRAAGSYAAGEAQVNFQLGYAAQSVELGGVAVTGFGKSVRLQDLPTTHFDYAGREAGAPWRAAALARIEAIRKGELTVRLTDAGGRPVPGASVAVTQRRHAFGFGSAVAAAALVGQDGDSRRYRETITSLFSRVVLENDLKWPNWEDRSQRDRTLRGLQWLHDQGLPVRGHTLVWPAWRYLPRDVMTLQNDAVALRRRVHDHVLDEVGALRGRLIDWDVVNEPFLNHDLMDILGEGAMGEWFHLARQADPAARLFLNEATIPGDGERQDHVERTARALLAGGAPLDGIGFQCHFGWSLAPPERLLQGLDRFARLGLPIQITELDVDVLDEGLQADYLRDFLIAAFSHPAVEAIVMWGFWEGRHWRPDAALFRQDWSVKPNGQVWIDLITRAWWTTARGETDAQGVYRTRGYLGSYTVEATLDRRAQAAPATLGQEGTTVDIVLE